MPTLMETLAAKAALIESTRSEALVRETPKPPKVEGFDDLAHAFVALRAAKMAERPVVELVVATDTAPPEVDAHKILAVPPAEAPPLQHYRRTK